MQTRHEKKKNRNKNTFHKLKIVMVTNYLAQRALTSTCNPAYTYQ